MTRPAFSICIPTYEAERFLDHAIDCACAQTIDDLEIIIAVDGSTDGTSALAHRRAAGDARIKVIEQRTRVGWTRNINAALNASTGAFYCLYFHDDTIEPNYLERLHRVLEAHPDAGSACGAVRVNLPDTTRIKSGRSFDDAADERMMRSLIGDDKGAIFRALTRREAVGDSLRAPEGSLHGFEANAAYLFRLVAAAPCIQIEDVLYERWAKREGGLVHSWQALQAEEIISDLKVVAAHIVRTIDTYASSPAQADNLTILAELELTRRLTMALRKRALSQTVTPSDLHPRFGESGRRIDALPVSWQARARAVQRRIEAQEDKAPRS